MPEDPTNRVRSPHDHRVAALCTGHKRDGSLCGAIAVTGKTKCRLHGGRSLSGMAAGGFKTGRYSKALPAQLAARYEEARASPRLLSLSDDIALAEAHLAALLEQVEQGAAGTTWQELRTTLDAFEGALAVGNLDGMQAQFATLQRLVQQGGQTAAAWQEIRRVWETRCKLVQTEVKTLQGMQQMVSTQQLMLYLGAITAAVTEAVKRHADTASGRAILTDIQAEFTRLSTLDEGR
jgi:hypothetical protein